MIYLNEFSFPSEDKEYNFIINERRTCYESFYPFKVLSTIGLRRLEFEDITILYGGNGSGKSTALNIIAEKLELKRDSVFNKTSFFSDYIQMCEYETRGMIPDNSRIITSDDVFDYMLNVRNLNEGIDNKRNEVFSEFLDAKYSKFKMKSLSDYDRLKQVNKARKMTQSGYVRSELMGNVKGFSNGESAYIHFTERLGENGLYILDEPENSLSPKRQIELIKFIEETVRFYKSQIIISTHSPFMLSMKNAKIYSLDEVPVKVKRWTELENVRCYFDFFKEHEKQFSTSNEDFM